MRRTFSLLFVTLFVLLAVLPFTVKAAGKRVYVLHVDEGQTIDPGLAQITKRVFTEAAQDPAAVAVAIIIDTPGGLVQSAQEMKKAILDSRLKTVAYVPGNAWSAGALIATAAEQIYMHPGTSIGAAEPRYQGSTETDHKAVSAFSAEFRSAAEARGRDPRIAQAMVDKNIKIPGQESELLTLTWNEAVKLRYADGEAQSLEDALAKAGIMDYELVDMAPKLSEQVGRFLTQPWVAILLLVVGVIAIGVEFIKPGVTLPGMIGVLCLGLFFAGNMLVGTADWTSLALALIGVVLLVIEAFVPGFGVFGVSGAIAMAASIFLAAPTTDLALMYLMWAALAFMVALFVIVRAVSRRGLGKALTLEKDAKGWVSPRADLAEMVGQEGKALTVLRPAGTAQFGAEKVDVVTEGEFVVAGTPVRVIRVEGTRVVVRSLA